VYRALQALPPQSSRVSIKITEQGEVISQKFGLEPIADRSLEVMLTGTLVARFDDWRRRSEPAAQTRYRDIMDELSAAALPVFRGLVYDDDRLFQLFLRATPVEELARVHFGSRPAYRKKGAGAMAGIRAIPWVFGWTQIRLMLPGWLGVGTALQQLISAGHIGELSQMASDWPFFDDLLGKVEMVCAKADLEISRLYIDTLGPDEALVSQLESEYERTVSALTQIRKRPLLADHVNLRSAIHLRNPYLDPLSLVQVELLRRKRELSPESNDSAAIDTGLGSALNGVAQGLRNTG
jgi:phosphoenolpyruvate carboxylase